MKLSKFLFLFGFALSIISCGSKTANTMLPVVMQATPSAVAQNVIGSNTPTIYPTFTPEAFTSQTSTAVATLDYVKLASRYLTPLPTFTPRTDIPTYAPIWTPITPKPTPNLSQVDAQKIPSGWEPTPPPIPDVGSLLFSTGEIHNFAADPTYVTSLIKATTDLMNFTNANQKLFTQYVDTWAPEGRYWFGATWLLEHDFDGDGNPEWLSSVPMYYQPPEPRCCSQLIILFEKDEGIFHPVHFIEKLSTKNATKVLLVDDLDNDGLSEIVVRRVYCGTWCSMDIYVFKWDGEIWTEDSISTVMPDIISFIDYNNDGKTEIALNYFTIYKLDSSYPVREATDIYGWKNGKLVLLEQLLSHNTEPYAIMRDVFSAISSGEFDEALKLAKPAMDKIPQSCKQMETYTAIEVMLIYGVQGKQEAMQSVLAQINTYCNQPDNGFTHAANILWQAYQQVHDPILACEAMKRFIIEQDPMHDNNPNLVFFDA
ncbi:MAG TPA: VCBS repeat-containing protein, partial [Anaerolineales bacterium]|nr:VCBS repeat-containing protein [Anaerolineales bacterium]